MFKNKKGALELSITAIVVIIIAITLLGFAIYFIKTMFGQTTQTFVSQFSELQQQLRKNMQTNGESVAFDVGSEIEVKKGTPLDFYVGIRNDLSNSAVTGTKVCYYLRVICTAAFTANNQLCKPTASSPSGLVVTGATGSWFTRFLPAWDIPNNEYDIRPVTIQVPSGVAADTYQMELDVWNDLKQLSCTDANSIANKVPSATDIPWKSYQFRVKVS